MTASPGWASNDPRLSEIGNNQVQLTELATYEERDRRLEPNPPEPFFLKSLLVSLLQNLVVYLMVIQPYFHSLTHLHTLARAPVSFLKSGRNLFNVFTLMLLTGHFILL